VQVLLELMTSGKEVGRMVFIITGAAESARNTVARFLADAWGWEFIDAEYLHRRGHPEDARRDSTPPAAADTSWGVETLRAAVYHWVYEWRDVVVSCSALTERERRQLSKVSSLVKIVCLEAPTARNSGQDLAGGAANPELPAAWRPSRKPAPDALTVDSSRQVEEIIAEITSVLMMCS
jgi:hypothetical protein